MPECRRRNELYLAEASATLPLVPTRPSLQPPQLVRTAGESALTDCRPFDLQCWLNEHPEYASEWYRRCVSTIKRAFAWTTEMELIERNPFARMHANRGQAHAGGP